MAANHVIGVLGLGLVGSALARRLAGAYTVLGFDVDASRLALLDAQCAGSSRTSVAHLAADCDCLLVAVFDDAQLRAVVAGILAASSRRVALVICITTALPATLREVGDLCQGAGLAFVEAPISGSSTKIAAGEGRMFVGGSPADIESATPLLDAITPHRQVIGPVGRASAAKLATNLVLGLNRAALAEGMALAESLGIERARYLELLLDSAATSRAAQEKGPMMVADHYAPPVATVAQHAKDVGLMLALGQETGQALPMSELHMEILQRSIERGDAALDNAAVIRVWRPARP
jgi:3-hydroxyisobutyrate dehydrogenase-like beta-hydroxyacid dehydrogenase